MIYKGYQIKRIKVDQYPTYWKMPRYLWDIMLDGTRKDTATSIQDAKFLIDQWTAKEVSNG